MVCRGSARSRISSSHLLKLKKFKNPVEGSAKVYGSYFVRIIFFSTLDPRKFSPIASLIGASQM